MTRKTVYSRGAGTYQDYSAGRHQAIGDLQHQSRSRCKQELEDIEQSGTMSSSWLAGYRDVLNGKPARDPDASKWIAPWNRRRENPRLIPRDSWVYMSGEDRGKFPMGTRSKRSQYDARNLGRMYALKFLDDLEEEEFNTPTSEDIDAAKSAGESALIEKVEREGILIDKLDVALNFFDDEFDREANNRYPWWRAIR